MSSPPPEAARIAHTVRLRWGTGSSMHWVLDVAFGDDRYRVRVDNAAENFAILQRIAMNLLRENRQTKMGLKIRRLKECTDDRYLAQLPGRHGSWRCNVSRNCPGTSTHPSYFLTFYDADTATLPEILQAPLFTKRSAPIPFLSAAIVPASALWFSNLLVRFPK